MSEASPEFWPSIVLFLIPVRPSLSLFLLSRDCRRRFVVISRVMSLLGSP